MSFVVRAVPSSLNSHGALGFGLHCVWVDECCEWFDLCPAFGGYECVGDFVDLVAGGDAWCGRGTP